MANEISTAGVLLKYKAESTAGSRPTSGYTTIPNIVSTGSINNEPESLEVTDLSDKEWRRYIPGLKDPGGAITFTANLTSAFKTAWDAIITAQSGLTGGKKMWFEIMVPTVGSFYFAGTASPLGINGYGVNDVNQVDVYITPNVLEGWGVSSTASVNPNSVTVKNGSSVTVTLYGFEGTPTTSFSVANKASASISGNVCTITGTGVGDTVLTLTDSDGDTATVSISVVAAS